MVAFAIGVLALVCAYYVGGMVVFQRRLLYLRPNVFGAPERPADAVQVWLPTAFGKVEAWYLAPLGAEPGPAPAIIFFHGNGELIDFVPGQFAEPRRWGMGVLLVEYPGYGRSSGAPSEQSITDVVLAAHDWAQSSESIDPRRIVAHGRSLGGAAAAILAARRSAAALVLESTFTSIRSFAHGFWLPEFVVLDPFDTLSALTGYGGAVLILHGKQDRLIPPHHAEELARVVADSELELLSCDHNDCPPPWSRVGQFLAARGVVGPLVSRPND